MTSFEVVRRWHRTHTKVHKCSIPQFLNDYVEYSVSWVTNPFLEIEGHNTSCEDQIYFFIILIFRTFGVKCSGCEDSIYPSDLVRRISNRFFHLSCLKCDQCKLEASTGDQIYLLDDGRFLCSKDYEIFAASVDEIKLNEG